MRRFYKNTTIQKASVIIFLTMLFINNTYSQDFKLAGIHYAHYPNSAIKDISGNQETSFQEFGAFFNFPTKFKNKKTVLVNGVGYGFVEVTMHDFPSLPTNEYKKKLKTFYYQLLFLHKWNEKCSLVANIKPTVASDFEQKLSTDDFIFQGVIIATRKVNDKFKIGIGVINSTRWGSPIIMPLVNMHYKNKKHRVNALLPLNFKYTYSLLPKEKLKLGVKYARNGANFNIYTSDLGEIDKINYSRANVGLLANYQLTKLLRLEAFGGISTGRINRLVDFNENVYDFDSKSSPFFSIGVVLVSPKRQ